MKKLPEVKGSWSGFYNLITASVRSRIVIASLELKLYDYLESPVSASEMAEKLGYDNRNLRLMLNAITAIGIITKNRGLFVNTSNAREFLVSSAPGYVGDFLLNVKNWNSMEVEDYKRLVKNGPPKESINMESEEFWAANTKLSAAYQYTGAAQGIAELKGFGSMRKMLDLGGGAGFYSIAVAALNPEIRIDIFDQPAVLKVTEGFIKEYALEDRISLKGGNYFTDELGEGYDLILASATLNFAKHELDHIMKRIYNSMTDGGYFISNSDGFLKEETHPVNFATEFLGGELMGRDWRFPSGFVADNMVKSGFNPVRSFFMENFSGEMEVTIGRK